MYEEPENVRRTGRSTRLAHWYIHKAMTNPNIPFLIKDHYPTVEADLCLCSLLRDIIRKLNYKGFEISTKEIIFRGFRK